MSSKVLTGLLRLSLIMCVLSPLQTYARDLVLTAPPRESFEDGNRIYGPIAEHLTRELGTKVVYKHPRDWMEYQRDMRNDMYDIVFDGPHFVSWRMEHLGHEVLVKLPGELQFVMITGKHNTQTSSTNDLVGKSICGISPPNLSTLSVLDQYRNPVRQPMIKGIKGGMGKVFSSLQQGDCDAAVLRTSYFAKKLDAKQREGMKRLFTSRAMPNQAISVSRRVSQGAKRKIAETLTMGNGVETTRGLLKRFGGNATTMIQASNDEYRNHNQLLEGVIFGW